MSTTRTALFTLAALGLAAFAAHPASAQSTISVINGDFSQPFASGIVTSQDYTTGQQIKGWTDNSLTVGTPGGSQYGVQKDQGNFNYVNPGADPDGGSQFLYVNQGNVFQTISLGTYAPGTTFTLTGDVLNRADSLTDGGYGGGFGTISFYSVNADGTLGSAVASASVTTPAALGTYDMLSATYTPTVAPSKIAIVLSGPSVTKQSDYDNIRLSSNNAPIASAAPEPSQIGMLALAALGLGALVVKARRRTTAAQTA